MNPPDPDRMVASVADAHGLAWTPSGTASARATLERALEKAGASTAAGFHRLLAETETARTALLEALTVGESYFFRESAQFEFIRQRVIPDLLAHRPPGHRLRIWSAGCASGEEPYTLAMMLREMGLASRATVLGTDASPRRLAAARRGRYSPWALRSTPPVSAEAYFRRQDASFVLAPAIREAVDFRLLNLAAETWPSRATGIHDFDLVICRNVLIYFTDPVVQSVATRLIASLAPGGWLCLGASDPALRARGPCETVMTGAGLAVRCEDPSRVRVAWPPPEFGDEPIDPAPTMDWAASTLPWATPSLDPIAIPISTLAPEPERPAPSDTWAASPPPAAALRDDVAAPLDGAAEAQASSSAVRALLDAGRLLDAEAASETALRAHPMSPDLHHVQALVLEGEGRLEPAVEAARRAVCLDPVFAAAHLTLGACLARIGHWREARRALSRASRLLGAMAPEARVPGADGETAGALRALARVHLERLADHGSAA